MKIIPETMRPVKMWIIILVIFLIVSMFYGGYTVAINRPTFDPAAVANAETAMWKAYYTEDQAALAWNLVSLFRSQFGLTWWEATRIGKNFAESAMKFRRGEKNHELAIVPGLIDAYRLIKKSSGANFDPAKAARAELAWWVGRRTPGRDSSKQVGKQITYLYTVLYGKEHPAFERAGLLRAQAAELRDQGGKQADWQRVEDLLNQSYQELANAFEQG